MRPFFFTLSYSILFSFSLAASTNSFPSAWTIFSANFSQPEPPPVHAEYRANWNQHKWNENVSHIGSGFIYNSPANKKVRVDETFDSALGSSLFDYTNVTQQGVANRQWILSPAVASPAECFRGYVNPGFPLISGELLIASGAVFGGVVEDPFVGSVATWNIMFQGAIPTRVLLDQDQVVRGYDFWATDERTYVVTRFFNIIVGTINSDVFKFPCS